MTTPATPAPHHVALANAAATAGDAAARLWGQLEAAERAAAAAWTAAGHAARDAGDQASADHAHDIAREHWRRADRLAAIFARHVFPRQLQRDAAR